MMIVVSAFSPWFVVCADTRRKFRNPTVAIPLKIFKACRSNPGAFLVRLRHSGWHPCECASVPRRGGGYAGCSCIEGNKESGSNWRWEQKRDGGESEGPPKKQRNTAAADTGLVLGCNKAFYKVHGRDRTQNEATRTTKSKQLLSKKGHPCHTYLCW